jgi:peptidoglycan hydrolase CwlO-like protein
MTSAAELAAQTACADLRAKLECVNRQNDTLAGRVQRLNALLVVYERERDERETQIAARNATIVALRAELAEARAGVVALPY